MLPEHIDMKLINRHLAHGHMLRHVATLLARATNKRENECCSFAVKHNWIKFDWISHRAESQMTSQHQTQRIASLWFNMYRLKCRHSWTRLVVVWASCKMYMHIIQKHTSNIWNFKHARFWFLRWNDAYERIEWNESVQYRYHKKSLRTDHMGIMFCRLCGGCVSGLLLLLLACVWWNTGDASAYREAMCALPFAIAWDSDIHFLSHCACCV